MSSGHLSDVRFLYYEEENGSDYAIEYVEAIYSEARQTHGDELLSWVYEIEEVYDDVKFDEIRVVYADILYKLCCEQSFTKKIETVKKVKSLYLDNTSNIKVADAYVQALINIGKYLPKAELADVVIKLQEMYKANPERELMAEGYALGLVNASYNQDADSRMKTIELLAEIYTKYQKNDKIILAYAAGLVNLSKIQDIKDIESTIAKLNGLYSNHKANTELAILYTHALTNLYQLEDESKKLEIESKIDEVYLEYPHIDKSKSENNKNDDLIEDEKGDFICKLVDGSIEILGFKKFHKDTPYKLNIPPEIGGYDVTSIGNKSFYSCEITDIKLPDSIRKIGDYAFFDNYIEKVKLPSNIESIGTNSFDYFKMKSMKISKKNEYFKIVKKALMSSDDKILYGLIGGHKKYKIPKTITTIIGGAFEDNSLKSIKFPNSVTFIGERAFCWNDFEKITLPKNIVHIGEKAFFSNCIKKVLVPKSVETIGSKAFDSIWLESLKIDSKNTNFKIVNKVLITADGKKLIAILDHDYTIPSSVTTIAKGVKPYSGFGPLELPEGIVTICDEAFEDNDYGYIEIPISVEAIGDRAFASNLWVAELTIPAGIKTIGDGAFAKNDFLGVEIEGDPTRFNHRWERIGLPLEFKPGILDDVKCVKWR